MPEMRVADFRGIVNFNERGEVVCFCYEHEYLQGKCPCRNEYDCPSAFISVEEIPGSRPSQQAPKKAIKKVKEVLQDVDKIKEGLAKLESAIKKNKRFRI